MPLESCLLQQVIANKNKLTQGIETNQSYSNIISLQVNERMFIKNQEQ